MPDFRLERVYEPSHIRRGRLAITPVWDIVLANGDRWTFQRRRDAVAFVDMGRACPEHTDGILRCEHCRGRKRPEPIEGKGYAIEDPRKQPGKLAR